MKDSKKILLSGKLSGTRTYTSELEQIENPDEIEKFLLYFSKLKLNIANSADEYNKKIKYINDDQDLLEVNEFILSSEFISIYCLENFSRLYLTIDSGETFIIRINKVSSAIIGLFISKEAPIKYAINSFNFIKWCNSKNIDIKNLYDIPTYIKLLTNDVDPFKTVEKYLSQYTDYTIDTENTEKNSIIISHFIYEFGKLLSQYINDFDLATVSRLINENSYYEGRNLNNNGNCIINISYTNTDTAIANISPEVITKFKNNAYIISPLNRVSPKFKQNVESLIYDIYAEDLSTTILNELYNNNLPVKYDYETNTYSITCKFKDFSNIVTLLTDIFSEVFSTIFDQSPEMHMESIIK